MSEPITAAKGKVPLDPNPPPINGDSDGDHYYSRSPEMRELYGRLYPDGDFVHERFIDLPIPLRSAIYPYGPQYLETLIEQTDLKIAISASTAPITLLEIKKTGKHSASTEELTLLEITDKHQTEGLLLILELLQTRFSKATSNPKRYFEKAAIAGISKLLASKLADQFETVMDMYLKAKKGGPIHRYLWILKITKWRCSKLHYWSSKHWNGRRS